MHANPSLILHVSSHCESAERAMDFGLTSGLNCTCTFWSERDFHSYLHYTIAIHQHPDSNPSASSKRCSGRANVKLGVSQLRLLEQLSHSLQGKTPEELMSFTLYLTVLSKLAGSQSQYNSDTLKEVFRTCFSLPQSIQTQHCRLHLIPLCKTSKS